MPVTTAQETPEDNEPVDQTVNGDELIGVSEEQGNEPYEYVKERKVVIQPYDYAVRTLMDMIIEEDLILDPDYQRKYQWDDLKASKFIESISLNIPVPVIYLAEEKDGSFSVIDGQQRLTSLFRFMKASDIEGVFTDPSILPLTINGLKILPEFNGKTYLELDRIFKSTIAKRPIRCIVVLNESDEALKFEVFERLNTGSASLTDQEVRNCVYRGAYNSLIKKLSSYDKFQELLSLPAHSLKSMKDSELVLRFLAYRDLGPTVEYSDNYSEYLNIHMEENRGLSPSRINEIDAIFKGTVDLIYEVLGSGVAFRKPKNRNNPTDNGFAHNVINGAIYESQMVAFSRVLDLEDKSDLATKALSAFSNDQYWECLFQGTSKRSKALRRSTILTDCLQAE
ncbi:DUF262 domain-containing protein [Yersinia enterocolitica]|uniref:DUF262 domain-containing protein n=1 Tax=Yersinia enterocolitica TaxID=630 RepID=UPI0005E70B8A|nr:DUF262 domain-containing protein [Yersinia enterocolitica]EKN3681973.1 DUF262 domain-containing protein [Yersinia enterocolitica]UYJ78490.1 DUF262 domain-containing protein [Yersinia enterocolitica]CNE95180.1 Uncharacterized conserved protein [Yersinia enterocolitica]HDL7752720.1 DUF262 domain-containing protein [Yersinia enterocolitica]HDW2133957.1 DUF262 domain-containing protein [Yersinia enterocolitica]